MIDSGLPLLTLNTESSYPDSLYFFSHLKNILGEIECSSQICACDLSPLRYSLTTLSLNSGGYTFLFCIRITPLNEFYHSLNSHPNPSWGEYEYINGWVYIHNLFKDSGGDKYAIVQSLLAIITPS